MSDNQINSRLEDLETDLFLEAVLRYYGYDFRDYERAAVRRRIRESMLEGGVSTVSRFQEKVLHQSAFLKRFLGAFSSTGLSMFSDPGFYQAFRTKVVPRLRTYPFIRIWQAGCSTGEEVYSLAILLKEADIYQRCRIYATDLSDESVRRARAGSFSTRSADKYAANYQQAGGIRSLSEYLKKKRNRLLIDPELRKNIVFSEHNLATDGSFNEFQVIICRGVLVAFNQRLRERVGRLIYESLSRFGILALGRSESLEAMPYGDRYEFLDKEAGLYQKDGSSVISVPGLRNRRIDNAVER